MASKTKVYITFGWGHEHFKNDEVFDKDCVAVIGCEDYEDGRRKAFKYFGPKWCFCYSEENWDPKKLEYFPRGLVLVDDDYFKE